MITKEEFCDYIKKIKEYFEFRSQLDNLLNTVIESPDLIDTCIRMLEDIMGVDKSADWYKDFGSDISYFIFELNFGKEWTENSITTKDGKSIDISTPEKLYDYLTLD